MSTLTAHDLSHAFGGLQAVHHLNIEVNSGEIIGIIGPNGAGKTTVFNLLSGIYPLQHGTIYLDQQLLNGFSVNRITQLGIARTFQNIRLFKALTVLDNVLVAIKNRYNILQALSRNVLFRQQEQMAKEQAYALLYRFDLTDYAEYFAHELPYGLQRRLEIARALAIQPKVLLLDEPACGMNPTEVQALAKLIREIQQEKNLAILLIDHQMSFVMSLCQRILALDFGKTIAVGDPDSIRKNQAVIDAYLGAAVC